MRINLIKTNIGLSGDYLSLTTDSTITSSTILEFRERFKEKFDGSLRIEIDDDRVITFYIRNVLDTALTEIELQNVKEFLDDFNNSPALGTIREQLVKKSL